MTVRTGRAGFGSCCVLADTFQGMCCCFGETGQVRGRAAGRCGREMTDHVDGGIFFFSRIYFFSDLYTLREAHTHDLDIESPVVLQRSPPGALGGMFKISFLSKNGGTRYCFRNI